VTASDLIMKALTTEITKRKNTSHQMKKKFLQYLKNSPFVLSIHIGFNLKSYGNPLIQGQT